MKILLYTYFYEDSELNAIVSASSVMLEQMKIKRDKKVGIVTVEIDTDSESFDIFAKVARNNFRINMVPNMCYTKEEIAQFKYFELKTTKVLRQQKSDVKLNSVQWEATPFIYPTRTSRIKLIDKIFISDLKVSDDTICCFEPYQEFILKNKVAKIFSDAALTGFETRPIVNSVTGEAYEDFCSLYSNSILPPIHEDFTVYDRQLSKSELLERQNTRSICVLGTEVYEASDQNFADFNRTSEGFVGGWSPEWIVSASVKRIYEHNKLKGWKFLPVFETGNELYATYLRKWKAVLDKVGKNSNMKLER